MRKRGDKRGQSSVEFTALIAFMFFIFVVFFAVVGSRFAEIRAENDRIALDDFGDYIKTEVSLAASAADGYKRTFALPLSLNGKKYIIDINEYTGEELNFSEMVLSYDSVSSDYSYVLRLPVRVSGDMNQYAGDEIMVTKVGNWIYLTSPPICGNGVCSGGENCKTCLLDCPAVCSPSGDGGLPSSQICGANVGVCKVGTQDCDMCLWYPCTGDALKGNEVCDNKDNDCDALTDEERDGLPLKQVCSNECSSGIETCEMGVWTGCTADPVPTYFGTSCFGGTGVCEYAGKYDCSHTCIQNPDSHPASPSKEICDEKDNDCDGDTDEGCESCTDECSPEGAKECWTRFSNRNCGYYDDDPCLDWSEPSACALTEMCIGDGICRSMIRWCYQEYANVSTPCGGVGTGRYGRTDYWTYNYSFTDGSWSTYDQPLLGNIDMFYINYTKPVKARNFSFWQIKDEGEMINLTIPQQCWNNPDSLRFMVDSFPSSSGTGYTEIKWSCWSGSGWDTLRLYKTNSGASYSRIYEDGMWWGFNYLRIFLNLNSSRVFPLSPVRLYGQVNDSDENIVPNWPIMIYIDGSPLPPEGWVYASWNYRKPIYIGVNTEDLSEFQLNLTLDTSSLISSGKMKSDCSDIRFADNRSHELSYWIESGCNTPYTRVWVKVNLTAGHNNHLYMYYGNQSAASGSDGESTFIFFDDFLGFDEDKWTKSLTGNYTLAPSNITIRTGAVYTDSVVSAQPGLMEEAKVAWKTTDANYAGLSIADAKSTQSGNDGSNKLIYFMTQSASKNVAAWAANGLSASYNLFSGKLQFTKTDNIDYIIGYSMNSTNISFYKDRSLTHSYGGTWSGDFYLWLGYFMGSAAGAADITNIVVDWVLVRKHTNPMPTQASVGDEEINGKTHTNSTGGFSYYFTAPRLAKEYVIKVNTSFENEDGEANISFRVVTMPVIESVTPVPSPVYFDSGTGGKSFFIRSNVTDEDSNIVCVNLSMTAPNGSAIVANINASLRAGDVWDSVSFIVDSYGEWNYSITATDSDNFTDNYSGTLNFLQITGEFDEWEVFPDSVVRISGHIYDSQWQNVANWPLRVYHPNSRLISEGIWWNTSWPNRTRIDLENSVAPQLNHMISLVNFSTAGLILSGDIRPDCGDVRFADYAGTELQYTLETSTCNSQNTEFWVWTNLTPSSYTTIYAYYGNPSATIKTNYTNPDPSLVLYMHFDNSSAYRENSTWAFDFSGYGNSKNITEANLTEGRFGRCLRFFQKTHSYVDVGTIPQIWNTTALSFCAWVMHNSSLDDDAIISKGSVLDPGEIYFFRDDVGQDSARTDIYKIHIKGSNGIIASIESATGKGYNKRVWKFVCFTFEAGSPTGLRLYVNGTEDSKSPESTELIDKIGGNPNNHTFIGAYAGDLRGTNAFNGTIDEVRIYNRTLSADEISALYNLTKAYFLPDESGIGTDASGNYEYTFTAPLTAGLYDVIVNATYNGEYGMQTIPLRVKSPPDINAITTVPFPMYYDSSTGGTSVRIHANVTDENILDVRFTVIDSDGTIILDNLPGTWEYIAAMEGFCYQESADQISECGGLGGGEYYNEMGDPALVDGDWETMGEFSSTLGVNYTKPEFSTANSVWTVKDDYGTLNIDLDTSCWEYDPDKMILMHDCAEDAWEGTSINSYYCYNGVWTEIGEWVNYDGRCEFYEEGMWWDISPPYDLWVSPEFTVDRYGEWSYTVAVTDEDGLSDNSAGTINFLQITESLSPITSIPHSLVRIYGHVNTSQWVNVESQPIMITINNNRVNVTDGWNYNPYWWNQNWPHRINISIENQVASQLNNTLVRVNLSTEGYISQGHMKPDCGDVRFADHEGKELQYTLETSTCNSSNTAFWVWTNLTPRSNTTIYAYYGNPSATIKTDYTNPDPSLVLYMHFDNASAYGETTNVYDFSTYGFHGVYQGNSFIDFSGGINGGALECDGTADYINTTDMSWSSTTNFTMMAWFNTRVTNVRGGILGKGTAASTTGEFRLTTGATGNDLNFSYNNAAGANQILLEKANVITANRWYHAVVTYNGSEAKLYLNGTEVDSDKTCSGTYMDKTTGVQIGYSYGGSSTDADFNGYIDEVRIYNRTLSAEEIRAIYNSTLTFFLNNQTATKTDPSGNYDYTFAAPSTPGTYVIKVNTTYSEEYGEQIATLTVN